MLEIKDLSISINDRYLIKNLNLVLNNGDKLAIIGEEGNGKSTLLKSILGICEYAEIIGNINLKENRIGYLEQSISTDKLDNSVYEFLFIDENDYYDKINNLYKYLELINPLSVNDTDKGIFSFLFSSIKYIPPFLQILHLLVHILLCFHFLYLPS